MECNYDIFISAKNLDDNGHPTKDREIAHSLWEFLTGQGFRVFFSNVSLEKMGIAAYSRAIDDALDRARVLVVVCSTGNNADSQWIRYEWDSFLNDVRSGIKPDGRVFVYLVNESIRNLPRALRHTQCIEHNEGGFIRLANFIRNESGQTIIHSSAEDSFPSLAGSWEGEWKRVSRSIIHKGIMTIQQSGQRLTAQLTVTFEKRGQRSVVKEVLRGAITSRCIVLQGESFKYEEHGLSKSYLLDHFELQLDGNGAVLSGDFYSKKGRGRATFTRIIT